MHNISLGTLFGIALIADTTWSVEPTVGKTPTVSLDPLATVTNLLSEVHYDHGFIFPEGQ